MGPAARAAQIATDLVAGLGYAGLAAGLVVDSAGIPIPSEVLLPLSGALVNQGRFGLAEVLIIGTAAQTAGAVLAYWIGATGGIVMVKRYGKFMFFNSRELAKTQAWFEKYGSWLTLAGRCLPIVRTYIGYPAGLARMNFGRFLVASLVGSFGWTLLLVWAGYVLQGNLELIDKVLGRFSILIVAVLTGLVGWHILRHLKRD